MSDFWIDDADWSLIPPHMHEGITAHVMDGRMTGSFLTNVLENAPLSIVMASADDQNRRALPGWVTFLYNFTPSECHGSPAKVEAWIKSGGINGRIARQEPGQ